MRGLVIAVAVALGGLLAGGYLGRFAGIGDALAVVRLPLAVVFALVVIWSDWPAALRWPLAAVALVILGQVLWLRFQDGTTGPVTVYQKNLLFNNPTPQAVVDDILTRAPDIVTLQEVSKSNLPILQKLAQTYPAQVFCDYASVGGVAVLSRWPATGEQVCLPGQGLTALQVMGPQGPVWLASVHLHWPWPYGQAPQAGGLMAQLAALDGPVIMAGDFNMMPWGWSVRGMIRAAGARRVSGLQPTLWKRGVPLPIDHVAAPGGGSFEVLPKLGSDHNGVLARVHLW